MGRLRCDIFIITFHVENWYRKKDSKQIKSKYLFQSENKLWRRRKYYHQTVFWIIEITNYSANMEIEQPQNKKIMGLDKWISLQSSDLSQLNGLTLLIKQNISNEEIC